MKKLFLTFAVVMMTLSSNANEIGSNDDCFSLSLDGKTISHIVLYTYDYENQRPDFTSVRKQALKIKDFRSLGFPS